MIFSRRYYQKASASALKKSRNLFGDMFIHNQHYSFPEKAKSCGGYALIRWNTCRSPQGEIRFQTHRSAADEKAGEIHGDTVLRKRQTLSMGEGAAGALTAAFSYSGSYHSIAIMLVTRAKICPSNFFVMPEPSSDTHYLSNILIKNYQYSKSYATQNLALIFPYKLIS